MGFDIQRLLYTNAGKYIISVILGIGLASLFQKVCKDKDCVVFRGPIISEVDGKIFKHDNNCYKYDIATSLCDTNKRVIEMNMDMDITRKNNIEGPNIYDRIKLWWPN